MAGHIAAASLAVAAAFAAPVPLPDYEPGDAFVFSDGRVERVINAEGATMTWAGLGGTSYQRSRNFVVPVLEWRNGRSTGRREVHGKPDALWPIGKGKAYTVKAGTYETIPVKCDRYSPTTMRLLEQREWDYAPELGHYVRRVTVNYLRGTTRTVELVAALSGPAASKARLTALARAARQSGASSKR